MLVHRGFDRHSIRECIFVALHSKKTLTTACDTHADKTPEEIARMAKDDQIALLNLIAYHIEKKTQSKKKKGETFTLD